MTQSTLAYLSAAAAMVGLIAYVLLAGADFGGGVWDFFATGPRKQQQRHAIEHALGPVWEANHVWLIFVIVVLFTCFPNGFASICIELFTPLHLTLIGIILRGAAFVFRKNGTVRAGKVFAVSHINIGSPRAWGVVFGSASIVAPFFLGAAFGAVTSGSMNVDASNATANTPIQIVRWLTPYSLACGLLAVSTCAYLAAVYLVMETKGSLREDFRHRAIFAGTTTAALAGVVLLLVKLQAPWFASQLFSPAALPVVSIGLLFFAASALSVFRCWPRAGAAFAIGEVIALLVGWGIAQRDYLMYPNVPLLAAAAPASTLRVVLWSLVIGLALVLPSMGLLLYVFKREAMH